ncbi:hypothetical protein [Marinospirillum sp.]|uniref:hypothetical protein n=1 Tax=Marinospirillum sp. TaxID=2183934 RepID=UPI00384E2480
MPKFKHYDYNQTAMVVINYQDQLQPGTFEHALHYLISGARSSALGVSFSSEA